jgi:hypothetical protein
LWFERYEFYKFYIFAVILFENRKRVGLFSPREHLAERVARAREVDWEEAAVMGLMETDGRGRRVS